MAQDRSPLCPADAMSALLAAAGADPVRGLKRLDDLLEQYPDDARLHFFQGSLLAGQSDFGAARSAMRRAVDLAPDFAVARFQLGFLLLTSGEPHAAQEAWGPLHGLPPGNFIRIFVDGLCHLIRDEFREAIRCLEDGISKNTENLPMNRDMQLIVDEIRSRRLDDGAASGQSAVDFLLQQSAFKSTRH